MNIPKPLWWAIIIAIAIKVLAPDSETADGIGEIWSAGRNASSTLFNTAGQGSQETGDFFAE